jgi:hypothetical protein
MPGKIDNSSPPSLKAKEVFAIMPMFAWDK